MAIILASKSPRRQELLRLLGLSYTVMTEDVDERMDPSIPPEHEVARVSALKAAAVLPLVDPEDVVICADTIVVLGGDVLGKPKSETEARAMLERLSGKTHRVLTAVTVCKGDARQSGVEQTKVTFRKLSAKEIDAYIETGEPMDKAGAYGIQGYGSCFVSGIRGDYFNVMGLPLCRLTSMLRSVGVPILGEDTNP